MREAESRPSEASLIFFPKVGCFKGKILGLRQTKKGVKIISMAGKLLSQIVGANQVTAEGGESLTAKLEFAYVKHHATMHACR